MLSVWYNETIHRPSPCFSECQNLTLDQISTYGTDHRTATFGFKHQFRCEFLGGSERSEDPLAVGSLLTFSPSGCAEHRKDGATWARACFARGEAWMPKRPSSGQGWPVDGPRSGCGAQGTGPSRFFFCDGPAQTPGAALLVTFGAVAKSNSP